MVSQLHPDALVSWQRLAIDMRFHAVTRSAEHAGSPAVFSIAVEGASILGHLRPDRPQVLNQPACCTFPPGRANARSGRRFFQGSSSLSQLQERISTARARLVAPMRAPKRRAAPGRRRLSSALGDLGDLARGALTALSSGEPDASWVGDYVAFFVACRAAIASRSTLSSCARKFAQLCLISFAVERRGEIIGAPP